MSHDKVEIGLVVLHYEAVLTAGADVGNGQVIMAQGDPAGVARREIAIDRNFRRVVSHHETDAIFTTRADIGDGQVIVAGVEDAIVA